MTKSFEIPKEMIVKAYKLVRQNQGSAGIDLQSLKMFDEDLKNNLYKIWNRLSSGCYFPPPVKSVAIPKKTGGERILGIPTVGDRVAQMVIKLMLEPNVEPYFAVDSYGYRPNKSAIQAISITRQRCWKYNWVVEFDIVGLFDNIPHTLLMKAVKKHTSCKWTLLYIQRWLTASMRLKDGKIVSREIGTPQGGVISPLLANLFLHYVFDVWMQREHQELPWCRYADDGLVHCKTAAQAYEIRSALEKRFQECQLELHPKKTRVVYCKDQNRRGNSEYTSFDFLGYTFKRRQAERKADGRLFMSFSPAVSKSSINSMKTKTRSFHIGRRTDLELDDIAKIFNPILRGWINYYAQFHGSGLDPVLKHFNMRLLAWASRKYRKLKGKKSASRKFIETIAIRDPNLFIHWKNGKVIGLT